MDTLTQKVLPAVIEGKIAVVRFAVKYFVKSDIENFKDPQGNTFLHIAILHEQKRIIDFLVKHLNVNIKNSYRETPLMTAALNNKEEMVKLLLLHGADFSFISYDKTVLLRTCEKGHENIVKILLDHGADVVSCGYYGRDLWIEEFQRLMKMGSNSMIQLFLNKAKKGGKFAKALLFAAYENEETEYLKMFLSGENNIGNVKGGSVDSMRLIDALLIKAVREKPLLVKLLVDLGANVNPRGSDLYETPLQFAVRTNNFDTVRFFVMHGADVNVRASYLSEVALHCAVVKGFDKIVEYLLKNQADIETYSYYFACAQTDSGKSMACNLIEFIVLKKLWKIAKIIVRHLVKLQLQQADKISLSHSNLLSSIDKNVRLSKYKKTCEAEYERNCKSEIERMKSKCFGDTVYSLHNVMSADSVCQLEIYARNTKVEKFLTTKTFDKCFPIYGERIRSNFQRGVERKNLLMCVRKFFLSLATRRRKKLPKIPDFCVELILRYLSDKDLLSLRDACK